MLKMSALAKCTLISILLALVVSSFPTTSVFAGANTNLVNKWEQPGFDAKGDVVDRASALKSIKDLSYYLQQHSGSVKNLHEHTSN